MTYAIEHNIKRVGKKPILPVIQKMLTEIFVSLTQSLEIHSIKSTAFISELIHIYPPNWSLDACKSEFQSETVQCLCLIIASAFSKSFFQVSYWSDMSTQSDYRVLDIKHWTGKEIS